MSNDEEGAREREGGKGRPKAEEEGKEGNSAKKKFPMANLE